MDPWSKTLHKQLTGTHLSGIVIFIERSIRLVAIQYNPVRSALINDLGDAHSTSIINLCLVQIPILIRERIF